MNTEKITNNPELKFSSLEDEEYRVYEFFESKQNDVVISLRIENPIALAVSKSGGHRILDSEGFSHYISAGWFHLYWKAKEGKLPFAF